MARDRNVAETVRTPLAVTLGAILAAALALASPAGAEPAWVARYDGPDGLNDEGAALALTPAGDSVGGHAVAVDGAGRITAIGTVAPFRAVLVTQLDADGQVRWTETFSDTEALNITAEAVAVDAAGNVYATGDGYGGVGAEPGLTVRYSPEGVAEPPIRYPGPMGASFPNATVVTAGDELAVAGSTLYEGLAGQFDVVLFDANGQVAWEYQTGGAGSATFDIARDIAVAGTGLVATGYVNGNTATNENVWTVRLDPAGQEIWSHQYTTGPTGADVGGPLGGDSDAFDLVADGAGSVYATGRSPSLDGDRDATTLKISDGLFADGFESGDISRWSTAVQ